MQANPPEIFIAYSDRDREFAEMLAKRLHSSDLNVWLDRETLEPGQSIDDEIISVLESCSVCLVLIGKDSDREFARFQRIKTAAGINSGPIGSSPIGGVASYPTILTTLENKFRNGNRQILPILLPDTKQDDLKNIPSFLKSLQWFEFQRLMENKASFKHLVDEIHNQSTTSDQPITGNGSANISFQAKATGVAKKIIRLPNIDWVEIPAGPFIYGEGETQQTIDLPHFYISRYPITNIHYQCFIDSGGYTDKHWWKDLVKQEPKESEWKQANRPKETVNWYEALAFSRWLSAKLNFEVMLPTEQQWEKAARGTDGREYPWGNDFKTDDANVYDSSAGDDNLLQTSAVGLYSHRTSPYGLEDMVGNVWEWCLNKYDEPEQVEPDRSGDSRVLRGGSWDLIPVRARCAYRLSLLPDLRLSSLGFRVVCLSPSTNH